MGGDPPGHPSVRHPAGRRSRSVSAAGEPALVEVDLQGARNLRETMPEALLVFISPPSWEALVERLVGRGTEAPDVVARRLQTAKEELAAQEEFDAVVVNTDLRSTAEELLKLILDKSSPISWRTTSDHPHRVGRTG